jgi:hypothetical protein
LRKNAVLKAKSVGVLERLKDIDKFEKSKAKRQDARIQRGKLSGELTTARERRERLKAQLSLAKPQELNVAIIASQFATRVSMVALALFLVQILVTMFRYYTRLAAFYDARADALVLVSRKVD